MHDEEQELYEAIGHPIRRQILRLISEQEIVTYSDLIAELQITPGRLYHHLGILKELVVQNKDKRYSLSPLGVQASKILDTGTDFVSTFPSQKGLGIQKNRFFTALSLEKLISGFVQAPIHSSLEALLIISVLGWLSSTMNSVVAGYIILFEGYSFPVSLLAVITSCLFVFLFFEGGSRYFFARPQGLRGVWFITVISFIPQTLFLGIGYLLFRFLGITRIPATIAFVIVTGLQVWSLQIQVFNLRKIKMLALEKVLVLALGALYANFLVLWVLNLI